ncbi:hypothetical protein ACQVR4_02485 [Streptococcus pyogenes]
MNKDFNNFAQSLSNGKTEEILEVIEYHYNRYAKESEGGSVNLEKLILSSSYFAALEMVL